MKTLSWHEISKHNTRTDCWIVIDGYVYDVTLWIQSHPGGDVIAILAGEDASALFHSCHLHDLHKPFKELIIAKVDHYQPQFKTYQDEFFVDLKQRVNRYFQNNNINYRQTYKNYLTVFLTALFLFFCWFVLYFFPPWGIVAAVPMGLATCSLLGAFGHEKIHGNFFPLASRKPGFWVLNNILWGLFIPLMPERYFQYEHIKHHNYPMNPTHDYDVYALKDFIRLSPDIKRKPYNAYQHIYAPFIYCIYLFLQLLGGYTTSFLDAREILKDKGALRDIIFSSLVAITFHIAIPIYLTSFWWVVLAAGIYFCTWQAAIYISAGLPHMTDAMAAKETSQAWAHYVCKHTKNLKCGNRFFDWVTGGLNYHLEHHLLSGIPREHLYAISPIVQKTCKEYGYPYHTYSKFLNYYRDHYQFLQTLGKA